MYKRQAFTQTNEVMRGKKFPDVYIKAAGKAGYDIKDCIVFEDVLSAAMGAKSGGFTVVAVYDEASSDDWDLICDVADYNIKNYSCLLYTSLEHLHMQARLRFRLTRLEYQRMLFQQLYRMLLSIFLSQSLLISTRK